MPILIISIVLSFVLSYGTALLADQFLTDRIPVLGSFVGLQYVLNPNVAFSLDLGKFQDVIIFLALGLVCVAAYQSAKTMWSQIGYGIIIGGALGNVIDRMMDGTVTDFFQVGTFPVFNVADSFITVGVVVLLGESLLLMRKGRNG